MAGQRKLNPSQWLETKWQSDSHCFSFPRITEVMSNTDALQDAVAQKVSVLAVILQTPRREKQETDACATGPWIENPDAPTFPVGLAESRLSTEYIIYQWI